MSPMTSLIGTGDCEHSEQIEATELLWEAGQHAYLSFCCPTTLCQTAFHGLEQTIHLGKSAENMLGQMLPLRDGALALRSVSAESTATYVGAPAELERAEGRNSHGTLHTLAKGHASGAAASYQGMVKVQIDLEQRIKSTSYGRVILSRAPGNLATRQAGEDERWLVSVATSVREHD